MTELVSKSIDQYLNVYADTNPIWWVELDNGEKVYQDDDRPSMDPSSAWLRLKQYCEEENVSIKTIYVKNRSVQKCVCSDGEGYTFCKAAGALMFGGETSHSFLFGEIKDGVYRVTKVNLPEMIIDRPEKRNIEDYKNLLIKGSKKIEEIQT